MTLGAGGPHPRRAGAEGTGSRALSAGKPPGRRPFSLAPALSTRSEYGSPCPRSPRARHTPVHDTSKPSSPAEELALLERELVRLDARRAQLLRRRCLADGRAARAAARGAARAAAAGRPGAAPAARPPRPVPRAPPPAPGAQHVLLVLGGLLLAVAAIAFTLFSWGELGIAGRVRRAGGGDGGALGRPCCCCAGGSARRPSRWRAVALLLTVLDAYALHAAVVPETDGAGYAALASGVLAAGWTVYGLGLGRLRLPLPAAVVAGQFPLVLGVWAAGGSALVIGWALLVTAAGSVVLAARVPGLAVRIHRLVGGRVELGGRAADRPRAVAVGERSRPTRPGRGRCCWPPRWWR